MKIILTAVDDRLHNAWLQKCDYLDCVEVRRGSILDGPAFCFVSPANSYGFMNGGIDQVYTDHFGIQLQNQVQNKIRIDHDGLLLVGQALWVETDNMDFPFMIAAPTMVTPEWLPSTTINPYLAARAALLVAKGAGFKEITFPGLGTGIGRVDPVVCAQQMAVAIEEVVNGNCAFPHNLSIAVKNHMLMSS